MKNISIKCPAKINLTLEVVNKRNDGYHNIKSVMQMINLYDYLDISAEPSLETQIILSGNNPDIPYDERNLVHKAAKLFLSKTGLSAIIKINIEKHIPVSAGLAGGSTDAAGILKGLNEFFACPLANEQLHTLCAKLGSDLNFCLEGGRQLTQGRGEILSPLPFEEFTVSLIKPISLGISAKEAYVKFSDKVNLSNDNSREGFKNDLEWAVLDDYAQLQQIKSTYPNSMMSGSGSTYFGIGFEFAEENGALFAATTTLCLSAFARPAAIWLAPHTDKENKKVACAKSISSSLAGYILMLGLSNPVAKAIKKIDKEPQKFLKSETIKNM